jgi:hypothetical protein
MRLCGTTPSTSVHADAQVPSIMTRCPDFRSASYLLKYVPTRPPLSPLIR